MDARLTVPRENAQVSIADSRNGADKPVTEWLAILATRPPAGELQGGLGSLPELAPDRRISPDLAQDRRGHQQRAFRMPQEAEACLAGVTLDVPLPSVICRPGGQ
jgi:hypothetical protein